MESVGCLQSSIGGSDITAKENSQIMKEASCFTVFFITVFDLFYLVNINVNFYSLKRVMFMTVKYNFIHLRWLKLICLKESDLEIKKDLLMRDCNMQTKSDG